MTDDQDIQRQLMTIEQEILEAAQHAGELSERLYAMYRQIDTGVSHD